MSENGINNSGFSVAISVYKNDNPIYFDRALSSITEVQSVIPNEVVLVVDGPISEDLKKVILKYKSKYDFFNVIYLEKNIGLGNALKIAIDNSKYELIARMDSDDVSSPTRFEEQLKYFQLHPDVDIVGGDITEFIGEEENIVGKRVVPVKNIEIREYMKKRCAMNHVSVMYKKKSVQCAGGYQDWFWNEDYFLWIRMWLNGAVFANTGTVLVNVRVGKEMYQRRGGKKYFESEKKLQDYMLKNKMIGIRTYFMNVIKRVIVQIIVPNRIRGWIFRTFARS
ncbi:MAG: glycosyltransferase [Lachnospiraceae bacterium]|nr:glycosyltransferase [Lachnospiraceae bacterium]